jgi:hypothetical protein
MSRKQSKRPTAKSHAKNPAGSPSKQLILILDETTGEIVGLARIGPGGKRYALADAEIAKVAGENELDDFSELIEEAYAAGIRDGMDDALGDHPEDAAGHETAGGQLLRSGVRRFVLRRALRRTATRIQTLPPHNGTSDAGRHS